jgi:4-hydroxy-4-methyl-2-oxoglutarate aldolase
VSALTPELLAELAALGPAMLYEAQGRTGALDPELKPLHPSARLAGPALTVAAEPGDNLIVHFALSRARPGDVLVVDAKAYTGAGAWGDILTLAAQERGVAGLVIDGAVRDANAIIEMGFPVFSRGICIRSAGKRRTGEVGTSISCGGVRIEPDDILVGDRDGLVKVARRELDVTLDAARGRAKAENQLRQAIRDGKLTLDLLNLRHVVTALKLDPTAAKDK